MLQSGAINAPWSNLKPEKSKKISDKLVEDCKCQVSLKRCSVENDLFFNVERYYERNDAVYEEFTCQEY